MNFGRWAFDCFSNVCPATTQRKYLRSGIWNAGVLGRSRPEAAETRGFGLSKFDRSSSFHPTKFNWQVGYLVRNVVSVPPPLASFHPLLVRYGRAATPWPSLSNSRSSSSYHRVANPGGPPEKPANPAKSQGWGRNPHAAPEAPFTRAWAFPDCHGVSSCRGVIGYGICEGGFQRLFQRPICLTYSK